LEFCRRVSTFKEISFFKDILTEKGLNSQVSRKRPTGGRQFAKRYGREEEVREAGDVDPPVPHPHYLLIIYIKMFETV
jgi:hypothetical protein